ncbi:LysR family transcriptional regulator [Duganella sp. sic0402]|uniref:LysR family transcriptional regulator n=1 Tax=Duganella sp. sic0402 TaxID=2854786 RepID=UPI001C45A6CE|nr:LysR family transcriptional regulator [Duganella sp. sic0402]MBV7537582.1 LysR family transcriptional regulator [Duganella sp. sic0402]
MDHENFNDLLAFVTVAREGSFTKAAAKMGVSQSALSHTIRGLETRLGIRLLTRTTRSVSPTEAGERLLQTAAPRFDEITQELASLSELRDKPAGTIRITAAEHAANHVLWPKLSPVMHDYPEVKIDINIDYGLTNIVTQRFDAGVRLGDQVEKDMIAVRISPDLRMALVATPDYFARRAKPRTPHELQQHSCINLRLPTHNNLMVWEFEKNGEPLNVRVDGQWVFNNTSSRLRAALAGYGIAYVPEDMVEEHLKEGTLIRVLRDWCPSWPGYHLYYPSRRQSSPAFNVVLDALRA